MPPAPSSQLSPSPLELILEARRRLGAGEPRDALRCAEEALRLAPRDPDALYYLGTAHYRCGDLAAAEARLKQAIQADGRSAVFHSTLGNVLQDRGALGEAISAYRRALRLKPDLAEAYNDLGTAYFARGDTVRAAESYERAAQLQPSHAVAYANLGSVYRKLGMAREARRALQKEFFLRLRNVFRPRRTDFAKEQLELGNPRLALRIAQLDRGPQADAIIGLARYRLGELGTDEAIAALERWLKLDPRSQGTRAALADLYLQKREWSKAENLNLPFHRGEALFKQGRTQEAEAAYREALAADRSHVTAWIRLGDLLRMGGRLAEAEACLAQAVALDDESAPALVALGMCLRDQGHASAAIKRFEQALRLEPQSALALQQMGEILRYENRIEAAEQCFRGGLKARPGDVRLLTDLAMVLGDQMRYQEAFACLGQALTTQPNSPLALAAKGILLDLVGREQEGESVLREALRASPDIDIGYNLAICQLRHARLAEGWAGFELRRQKDNFIGRYREFPFPEWQGEPLAGKALLVYPEQGLGDEIMYGSCLPEVIARARHVAIECDPKLGALFARSFPGSSVMPRPRTMANDWVNHLDPKPDYQMPIGSLPGHFRRSPADFSQSGNYLKADAEKTDKWRKKLETLGPGRKIGLSWQGGVGHTGRLRRSLTLEQLLPILRLPGLQFVSLQYTEVQQEIEALAQRHGVRVHHWREAIDDYDETAALVCALDKVLTVCTAIVHLSGALGRPAIVMVPFGSDWRYGAKGERMLWYPSVRLVRQTAIGNWQDVLDAVQRTT